MVSVIIPVYKVEKYLHECVDSVLEQTYRDLEIILVDDGSPDRCGEICDEYARLDSRVTVIHKENGGQSDARNAGVDIAKGKYIYFADGDDILTPDTIKRLVTRAKQENADIVYCDAKTIYEDFNDKDYFEELIRHKSYHTTNGAKVLGAHLKNKDLLAMPCLHLYRRDFWNDNEFRYKKGIIHEDQLLMPITYMRAGRVAQIKEPLYIRRLRANSTMSAKDTAKSICGLTAGIEGFIEELNRYENGSFEHKTMLYCIDIHAGVIMHKFALLDKEQKKASLCYIKNTARLLSGLHYTGGWATQLKFDHPYLFVAVRKILLPLKKLLEKKTS